eukprot:gene22744-biopygen7227
MDLTTQASRMAEMFCSGRHRVFWCRVFFWRRRCEKSWSSTGGIFRCLRHLPYHGSCPAAVPSALCGGEGRDMGWRGDLGRNGGLRETYRMCSEDFDRSRETSKGDHRHRPDKDRSRPSSIDFGIIANIAESFCCRTKNHMTNKQTDGACDLGRRGSASGSESHAQHFQPRDTRAPEIASSSRAGGSGGQWRPYLSNYRVFG